MLKTSLCLVILVSFLVSSVLGPMPQAEAEDFHLPAPGVMVPLSPLFDPPILKGLKVNPNNPFRFEFILDNGNNSLPLRGEGSGGGHQEQLKFEATKLIKYFLASLTIPENDLWVNLSPYEKNRIIPKGFGLTEMGRDLLAEDYMLKQITASLIYPEGKTGQQFWKRIYQEAAKRFGTTNIPVNTFNKVWIVPEKAIVYENAKTGTAYIVESKLKVMLEEDYLALEKNDKELSFPNASVGDLEHPRTRFPTKAFGNDSKGISALSSKIIREIVIPALTKEVNENKNFAQLRQVYNSLILATWYKKKIKDSILKQVYTDKNKVNGLSSASIGDPQRIYQQYLKAFKKGVFNYIKEDAPEVSLRGTKGDVAISNRNIIPRKYFSGGLGFAGHINQAMTFTKTISATQLNQTNLAMVSSELKMSLKDVLNAPFYPTPEKRYHLAGKGKVARSIKDVKGLVWLTLTDHIEVRFVPRGQEGKDFLKPLTVDLPGEPSIFRFVLPEDLTLLETMHLIHHIRTLVPLTDERMILPQLPASFRKAAVYLAKKYQNRMTKKQALVIRTYYALSIILDPKAVKGPMTDIDQLEIPTMSNLIREKTDLAFENEVEEFLGSDGSTSFKPGALKSRAIELAVHGAQIELESLTYWRGMRSLKNDLQLKGVNNKWSSWLKTFLILFDLRVSDVRSNNPLPNEARVEELKNKIVEARKGSAQDASKIELSVISEIMSPIIRIPRAKKNDDLSTYVESSAALIRLNNKMNCVGKSALLALYLEEVGIKVFSVSLIGHAAIVVQLENKKYYYIESSHVDGLNSGIQSMSKIKLTQLIPSDGVTVNWKWNAGVNELAFIAPWRKGLLSMFYQNLGLEFLRENDHERAIEVLKKSEALLPDSPKVYVFLSDAYYHSGDYKSALSYIQRFISSDPGNNNGYSLRGQILLKMGDVQGAISSYRKAIELKPNDFEDHFSLGDILMDVDFPGAVAAFRMAVQLKPKHAQTHYRLAIALKAVGNSQESEKEFQKARKLGYQPTDEGAGHQYSDRSLMNGGASFKNSAMKVKPKFDKNNQLSSITWPDAYQIKKLDIAYDSMGQVNKLVLVKGKNDGKDSTAEILLDGDREFHFNYVSGVPNLWIEEKGRKWIFSGYDLIERNADGSKEQSYVTIKRFGDQYTALESDSHVDMFDFLKLMKNKNRNLRLVNIDLHHDVYYNPFGQLQAIKKTLSNMAMKADLKKNIGGIDLTAGRMNVQIKTRSSTGTFGDGNGLTVRSDKGIKFHLSPAMLSALRNSSGFTPVIINIQPLKSLKQFLGVEEGAITSS